jgi:2-keto-4-pentenoate hydratase/2-oxohepta-3-ene-1,7-dioic acid hydratase in catechol pathway
MKLLSYLFRDSRRFGALAGDEVADLTTYLGSKFASLKAVIEADAKLECLAALDRAPRIPIENIQFLSPVLEPDKIICVGVNYRDRNAEYKDKSSQPKYPSIFLRTPGSLVGHDEVILRPAESEQLDYEGEIAIVIGKVGRRIPEARARDHVFGLTLVNEGSVRDWMRHGKFNVTQGKTFEKSGSIGPWIATTDELPNFDALTMITLVNGEERQRGFTGDLMFPFAKLVAYISIFMELSPGDIISTGTPVGAGARFDPPRWLCPGDIVSVSVPEIGTLRNQIDDEQV